MDRPLLTLTKIAQPLIGLYVAYAVFAEYAALAGMAAGPVPFQVWFYNRPRFVLPGAVLRDLAAAGGGSENGLSVNSPRSYE